MLQRGNAVYGALRHGTQSVAEGIPTETVRTKANNKRKQNDRPT